MGQLKVNLSYPDNVTAQARADKIHQDLITSSRLYAESAALYDEKNPEKGGTARWCFPQQELDAQGQPVGTQWYTQVDERVKPVLAVAELYEVPEWVAELPSAMMDETGKPILNGDGNVILLD